MGAVTRLIPHRWQSQPLSPEDKEKNFREAKTRYNELQLYGRAYRKTGYVVGFSGCAVGVLGMVCAASLFPLKQNVDHYWQVEPGTGLVLPSKSAADAPQMFGDQTEQQYARAYIEARESYVYETADLSYHRAAVMSSPDEQRIYADWWSARTNPNSPQVRYGRKGSVRVSNFRFFKNPHEGKNKTISYDVHFTRMEVVGGEITARHEWTAVVQWQWHPELPMADEQDRAINPAGMQVLAYGSHPD